MNENAAGAQKMQLQGLQNITQGYGAPTLTLRQNIDRQIAAAKDRVSTLESTKERLERSNLLDIRIDDLQAAAMRW